MPGAVLSTVVTPTNAGGSTPASSSQTDSRSRGELEAASDAVGRLTPPELDSDGQDAGFRAELLRRYPSLRRFMPALLEVMPFEATGAGKPILDALDALRSIEGRPGRVAAALVRFAPARCGQGTACTQTRILAGFQHRDPAASNKLAGVDDSGTPASRHGRTASNAYAYRANLRRCY